MTRSHGEMQTLLASTEITSFFLDRELRVQRYTPSADALFNFQSTDGDLLRQLSSRLKYQHLEEDARAVLADLISIEREMQTGDRRWFVLSVRPESTSENKIAGVVFTIIDITTGKQAEEALCQREAEYRTLFEAINEGFCVFETLFRSMDEGFCILQMIYDEEERPIDYCFIEINPIFERQTGMKDALGGTIRELVPNIERFWFDIYGRVALTGEPTSCVDHARSMGRWFDVNAFRIGDPTARQVAVLFTDSTERM
jgi:two-component system, chemotaxis family, CheB/CheR fusion protein